MTEIDVMYKEIKEATVTDLRKSFFDDLAIQINYYDEDETMSDDAKSAYCRIAKVLFGINESEMTYYIDEEQKDHLCRLEETKKRLEKKFAEIMAKRS